MYKDQNGSVLLVLMVLVSLMGIGALAAAQSWKDRMQREREVELLWRGEQYRLAVQSYYQRQASGVQGQYPLELKELLQDRRGIRVVKHIRQLFPDPFTGNPFAPVRGPDGRIRGVRSTSQLVPFKQGDFSDEEEGFELAQSYSEWAFVYRPPKKKKTVQPEESPETTESETPQPSTTSPSLVVGNPPEE